MRSNVLVEPLGIVVAMPLEARSLRPGRSRGGAGEPALRRCVVVSGVGPQRAAAAAERLVARGAGHLLSVGVAGALVPALSPGTLFVADAVVGADEPSVSFRADGLWHWRLLAGVRERVRVRRGVLATSARAVLSPAAKQALAARTGAAALDMEAAAVARVAARAGVPFAAIKAICDPLERCVPASALGLVRESGRLDVRALLGVLARGPSAWRALAAPARDYAAARRALAALAAALAAELAP